MSIKKGLEVLVISGSEKGKKGIILAVDRKGGKALVSGLNLCKRHTKPTKENSGGIVLKESWLHLSNLSLPEKTKVKPRQA